MDRLYLVLPRWQIPMFYELYGDAIDYYELKYIPEIIDENLQLQRI